MPLPSVVQHEEKPFIVLDATQITAERASAAIVRFIAENEISVLNAAGPRLSVLAEGYGFTLRVIGDVIAHV
jgi:hypothetical protein